MIWVVYNQSQFLYLILHLYCRFALISNDLGAYLSEYTGGVYSVCLISTTIFGVCLTYCVDESTQASSNDIRLII